MNNTTEEKIRLLEDRVTKLSVEAVALREVIVQIFERLGIPARDVVGMIESQDARSWDQFLSHLESNDPAKAAKLDRRDISDVLTEG